MTNKELQEELKKYPDDYEVKNGDDGVFVAVQHIEHDNKEIYLY